VALCVFADGHSVSKRFAVSVFKTIQPLLYGEHGGYRYLRAVGTCLTRWRASLRKKTDDILNLNCFSYHSVGPHRVTTTKKSRAGQHVGSGPRRIYKVFQI
jgi:hypothetical protein